MKKYTLFLLVTIAFTVKSQEQKYLGESFVLKQNYSAQQCDAVGSNPVNVNDALERTFIVIVEAITANGYVVSLPAF